MPSKTKKHQSKSQSRLSQQSDGYGYSSSSTPTPSTSSRAPTLNSDLCDDELLLSSYIEEASRKFPSLIGKSAVIGRITEVQSQSKGSRIWLSESSMVAASISPGSTVSVSLVSLNKECFPLASFSAEYAGFFDVNHEEQTVDSAGNYFALATVSPCRKLQKNDVILSLNLLRSMGYPASGRIVFVHLIQSGYLTSHMHMDDKLYISIAKCKELLLEVVPSSGVSVTEWDIISPFKGPADPTSVLPENGKVFAPQTPQSHRSRIHSPSPVKLNSSASKDSSSGLRNINGVYFNSSDISEVLADESVKKLLQHCVASWLCSHSLLCGNILTVPLLSKLCVFRVIGAKRLSADSLSKDFNGNTDSIQHGNDAFTVDHDTMIHICLPADLTSDIQAGRSLTSEGIKYSGSTASTGDENVKIGGLQKEYALLMDIISSSAKNILSSLGLRTTKGVLLHGPPGTGKTSLAHLCACDAGISFFKVNGPEIISQYHGESEQALHKIFDSASQAVPSVIFIDELDAIAPARKEGGEELSQRMVATLLNLMDGISRTDGLLVIAATNRLESIEPALRRPGRLDREIEIGVPSPAQRLDILVTILNGMDHSLTFDQVQQLAVVTHGFVGADLVALCNEAGMVCLRHYASCKNSHNNITDTDMANQSSKIQNDSGELSLWCDLDSLSSTNTKSMGPPDTVPSHAIKESHTESTNAIQNAVAESNTCSPVIEEDNKLEVTFADFEKAKIKVRPSAMREVILEVPKVKWEDVGGQEEVKTQLIEAVEWPQTHQGAFKRIGTWPPTGILLFGPPGCSKTLMARAVASEAGLNFLSVKGPELFSKWVGESEKAVKSLFSKARVNAPSIIFFDEIDGLAIIRGKESDGISVADRVMSQLLVELDGLHERVDVTVIAATNRPDKIDPALLRPGRFDRLLFVGPPTAKDLEDIFRIHLRKIPCSSDVDIEELARLAKGCTGADISLICREAAIIAIQESLDASVVKMEHLKLAIKQVEPSEILPYHRLSEKFQRLVHSIAKPGEPASKPQEERSNWLSFRNLFTWTMPNIFGFRSYRS